MARKIGIRAGEDRRTLERGPPSGWVERRKRVERRLPVVVEIAFSEWLEYRSLKQLVEVR